MAKISPVSIKYMIYANFRAEGALEKPDIIGAIFGQTEGLLGADLEMRELQKEGKIGRIEVELERKDKITTGVIKIPTALDQSETTLIAAAVETIDRIGPCDSQIEVEKIEDVRKNKRDYILERAKKLMNELSGSTNSREIVTQIKESAKMDAIQEYGDEKLPCGDLSKDEIIVVEGRADVLNLLKNGINNVIGMKGTKLPDAIKELSEKKELTLFVDGDRGGKLIAQNVIANTNVKNIAFAPHGKEVEELTGKEIIASLRKKIPVKEFLEANGDSFLNGSSGPSKNENKKTDKIEITPEIKNKLKEIFKGLKGSEKAVLFDKNLEKIEETTSKRLNTLLKKIEQAPDFIVLDGKATLQVIKNAENAGCKALVAKNFAANNTSMKLLSF